MLARSSTFSKKVMLEGISKLKLSDKVYARGNNTVKEREGNRNERKKGKVLPSGKFSSLRTNRAF
jgi:hypothetical protein